MKFHVALGLFFSSRRFGRAHQQHGDDGHASHADQTYTQSGQTFVFFVDNLLTSSRGVGIIQHPAISRIVNPSLSIGYPRNVLYPQQAVDADLTSTIRRKGEFSSLKLVIRVFNVRIDDWKGEEAAGTLAGDRRRVEVMDSVACLEMRWTREAVTRGSAKNCYV